MSIVGGLIEAGIQGAHKVVARTVNGPASYTAGGFTVVVPELDEVKIAAVSLRNPADNHLIRYSVSGNTITIQVFTIAADANGNITATEVANGTDLSALVFDIVAVGY